MVGRVWQISIRITISLFNLYVYFVLALWRQVVLISLPFCSMLVVVYVMYILYRIHVIITSIINMIICSLN